MTDERDDEIHAAPPFAGEEGEGVGPTGTAASVPRTELAEAKKPPRDIIYAGGFEADEDAENGKRAGDTVQPVNSVGVVCGADEPEAEAPETFEAEVPDHEAAKLRIVNKDEPLLDKKGKGKGKTDTPAESVPALVLTGAPEPEELVLVRPWTKAESEDADKKMIKAGGDLFKRMEVFRKCVLEFDAHRGWAQLGFRNVRDWAAARFGIEGKGIYAELTAARTEQVLTAVIEKENEEGREVPVPPKIPRDMLLALKDVAAEKMPEVIEAAYTLAEAEVKASGKETKVVASAKNVKDAINTLGLKNSSGRPARQATSSKPPEKDASGVGDFFGSFDPTANPPLPGTTEETTATVTVGETPTPPALDVEVSPPSEYKPIPLPIVGQIAYDPTTKVVSFFATVQGTTYELRALKSEFPTSMFEVGDLFPTASAAGAGKRGKKGDKPADTPTD